MVVWRRAGTDTGGGTSTVYRAQSVQFADGAVKAQLGSAGHACAHTICFLLSVAFAEFIRKVGLVPDRYAYFRGAGHLSFPESGFGV